MRCGSGSTGAPHRGDELSFEIELTFRDRSSRSTSIGSMDRGSSSSDASSLRCSIARRMTVGISLRWSTVFEVDLVVRGG
ncbi:hypothetical protein IGNATIUSPATJAC_93 [Mycobacterium phage IgnatiusPatJac]|nr:hypothetical protein IGNATIUSPATJAC_93 [Mycobacterium phage IgnatiusPatJac]